MRRIFVIVVVMLVILVVPVGVALAQGKGPEPNAHNCGGTSSVGTMEQVGGGQEFGDLVSDVAQEQQVDNVTQANCNQNSGQNP
jgi:hypothetical protein